MMKRTVALAACLAALSACSSEEERSSGTEVASPSADVPTACEFVADYESSHGSRTTPAEELDGMRAVVRNLDAATRDLPSEDGEALRGYMRSVARMLEVDSDPASTGIEMADSQSTYYLRLKEVGDACKAAGSPIA